MKNWISHKIGRFLIWLNKIGVLEDILNVIDEIGIKDNLISGLVMRQVLSVLKPGDIILIRAFGEASSLFIGQGFTHSALQCKIKKHIIDSTGTKGVAKRDILELFQGTSSISVVRLKDWTESEIKLLMSRAEHYVAKKIPYDYGFAGDKEEMYCSEFLSHCINDIKPNTLGLRERFGVGTITPEDLYKAKRVFDVIFTYKI